MTNKKLTIKRGFTLIELLVVISIIGLLAVLVATNLNEARARARDSKEKQDIGQVKTALRLYYNDFGGYPATGNGTAFNACGNLGTTSCNVNNPWTAGSTTYMNQLPLTSDNTNFEFKYYPCNAEDSFRLVVTLENASDPDIAVSQNNRCPAASCTLTSGTLSYGSTDYVVCAD